MSGRRNYRAPALSLALIALLVASSIVAPLTVAYPTSDGIETTELQTTQSAEALTVTCDLGNFLNPDVSCSFEPDNIDSNLSHYEAYQEGLGQIASQDTFLSVFNNYAKDTEDVAWLVAERAIYDALNNGLTQTQAQSKAQVAVQEYYQKKKYNFLDFYNTHVTVLDTLMNSSGSVAYAPLNPSVSDDYYSDSQSFHGVSGTFTQEFDKINKSIEVKKLGGNWDFTT